MCADEMTTGSLMTTAADRATLANRSHAFNITQPKFRKIFPEYSKEKQIDLPNMGETKKVTEGSQSATSALGSTKDEKAADTETSPAGKV
jgi:ubiquitin-conjugating enzyme E2 J2